MGARQSVQLFGTDYETPDGTCIRDYVHVSDIADAHVRCLAAIDDLGAEAFNLGNGHGYSNRQVIDAVRRVTGRPIESWQRRGGRVIRRGSWRARTDREALGWQPAWNSLDSMIESAWRWNVSGIPRLAEFATMIISRTPLRVSFVGGGSDLEDFYRHEPGAVVTTALRKYIYITVNQKFDSASAPVIR